jgi:hypothetical protein
VVDVPADAERLQAGVRNQEGDGHVFGFENCSSPNHQMWTQLLNGGNCCPLLRSDPLACDGKKCAGGE